MVKRRLNMKVKELIGKLKKCPEDFEMILEVGIEDSNKFKVIMNKVTKKIILRD